MLFDVLTGILSVIFVVLSMLYPFRRKLTALGKISKLKFHCIVGSLLLIVSLVHINFNVLHPYLSAGFFAFFALIGVAVTGFLKRRYMKNKPLLYLHRAFVGIFILGILVHAVQQIINLLIM